MSPVLAHRRPSEGPVMIMAGGTGGHIFPGLAIAAELVARKVPVIWLGAKGGLETRLVPQHDLPMEMLSIGGVRGKGMLIALRSPFQLLGSIGAARSIIKRHAPRSVLSMGGYVAAPGGFGAWLGHLPLVVHEQNSVPGLTNKLLARLARRVLVGFPGAFPQGEWVGNPVRASIADVPSPSERYEGRDGALRLLVLGGSQGAASLNAQLPEVLRRRGSRVVFSVRHQCGEKHVEKTRAAYLAADIEAEVVPFIDDMAAAYEWADVAICRSGALTLAELAAAGVPAVLVPYPHAVDDHQTRNAESMVAAGGARCVSEGDEFLRRLGSALDELADRRRLVRMAEAARSLARPDAASRIADACLEVAA